MSNVTKCQMSRNVKCHEMSNVTKFQMSQNVKCHEMSNVPQNNGRVKVLTVILGHFESYLDTTGNVQSPWWWGFTCSLKGCSTTDIQFEKNYYICQFFILVWKH